MLQVLVGVRESVVVTAALVLAVVVLGAFALWQHRQEQDARKPQLPDADRAPAGLSRLVPMGRDLDRHISRGVDQLVEYLIVHRRHTDSV